MEGGGRARASTPDAAAPATAADLVDIGAQVRFRHPLVRSAVYGAAAPEDRQRVHRALAEATDADVDPDRRAWHRAQATGGLDEDVAAELERSAGRARARGGLAAGAAFHERAAELTPDPRRRAQRALAAAQGKHQAGAPDAALRLLAMAQAGPLDELEQARAQLLHAQITFATTRGRDAPPLLLEAAKRLEPLDATLARETYLEAFAAALSADRLVRGGDAREVAAAVLAADWEPSTRACDLLLDGLALLTTRGLHGRGAGVEGGAARVPGRGALRGGGAALALAGLPHRPGARRRRGLGRAHRAPGRARPPRRRALAAARRPRRPVHVELFAGRIAVGHVAGRRGGRGRRGHRQPPHPARRRSRWRNWRGRDAEALALIEARRQDVLRRGEGLWLAATDWGSAVRYNGLGRYDDALAAAERAAEDPRGLGARQWVLSDLIEAAVRSGQPERAAGPLERLAEIAEANGTDWALGVHARSRGAAQRGRDRRAALPRGDRAARPHAHPRRRWPARTSSTASGCGARTAASTRASSCASRTTMLTDMGMEAFAERARRELLATGETVRKRTVETLDDLTPQEAQIARLAADGHTNPEIGAQLFLSPRTVEWHLRKVFGKLGISSRRELRTALPAGGSCPSRTGTRRCRPRPAPAPGTGRRARSRGRCGSARQGSARPSGS